MKVALSGAGGMLGSDILRAFHGLDLIPFSRGDFDITSLDQTIAAVTEARPDLFIHAAAYTDVDGCEHDPDKAFLVNAAGARNVAVACEENACPVMYISSDYVFDGEKGEPYNEWDDASPVSVYGTSKFLGEKYIASLTNRYYIVRTSWLYGKQGRNFVDTMRRLLREKEELDVVDDQVGSPTHTYDLACSLKELAGKGYGTYHITNTGNCSWHDFAVEIARLCGSSTRINRTTSDQFQRPARRPAYSVLHNTMSRIEGLTPMRPWNEALREYLSS